MKKDTHIAVLYRIRKLPKDKDGYVKRIDVTKNDSEKRRAINDMVDRGYIEQRHRLTDNEYVLRMKPEGVDFLNRNHSSILNIKFNKRRLMWIVIGALIVAVIGYLKYTLEQNQEEQKLKESRQIPEDKSSNVHDQNVQNLGDLINVSSDTIKGE